ncbi:MAG TPA: glycosyltransferase family 39 protein [Acidobacteriaceae bacterium]|jgi:4-amino-4-deoxy-L-arabinose transferase-like glycosyltransferase|nr:glycosyltransferase family 39 protein [Acidobacteriaceae bacterium]
MPSLFTLVMLAAGAVLRLWFIHLHPQVQGDSLLYGDIAANWLTHGIYGHSVGHASGLTTIEPTLVRLPGYPAFLALCFAAFGVANYRAVVYLQALIDLGTCLLIAGLAAKICGQRAGRIALVLAALCPFTANYVAFPLTETLSIFCVALGFRALAEVLEGPRPLWTALLIFSWSLAALLRPDGALLAVVLWTALIIYGRNSLGLSSALRLALIAGLVSLLPFAAWTVRNWHTFHVFQPLAPRYANDPGEFGAPGFVRWVRTLAADFTTTSEIYWNGNSDRIDPANLPTRAMDNPAQHQETDRLLQDYNAITSLTPEIDARFAQLAKERIQLHPFRYYLTLPLLRLADMWLRPRVETMNVHLRWWEYDQHPAETWVAIFYGALNLAYLVAALLGVLRRPRMAGAMIALIVLRSLLLATLEAPESRYTLECFPVVMVLAACYFTTWLVPGGGLSWKTSAARVVL